MRLFSVVLSALATSCVFLACSDDASAPPASAGNSGSAGATAAGAGGSIAAGGFSGGSLGGAAGAPTKAVVACSNAVQSGDGCATAGECCRTIVPDGPTTHLRCGAQGWAADVTCAPVPMCASPLTGKLVRADGTELAVSCVRPASKKPPSLDLSVGSETMRLSFASLPTAGAVFQIVPELALEPEAPQDRASFELGFYGGIAGFNADARGVSGTITVSEAMVDPAGQLLSVHATLDAQTTAPGGKSDPPGKWDGPLTGSF